MSADLQEAFAAVMAGDPGTDRHAVFARCREEAPIFFSAQLDSWVLSRYADVRAVLADEDGFGPLTRGAGAPIFGRTFREMGGREHNKKAGTVARRIRSPRAFTEGLDAAIEHISRERADALPLGATIDFKADFAMWVPLLVIAELTQIHEAGRFRDWYRLIAGAGIASVANPGAREAGYAALADLEAFITPIIDARRAAPGEDLVSTLAASTYDGEPLGEAEIVATVVFLLTAGVETTERVLTSLFRHLLLDPGAYAAVRAARGDDDAVTAICAEALRMFPPVQGINRLALAPTRLHDAEIHEGQRVVVLLASANRDETAFPDPATFDAARWADNPGRQFTTTGDIMPFGGGRHHCTGSRLAAAEMREAIKAFTERVGAIEAIGAPPAPEGFILHSPATLPMVLRAAG